MPSYNSGASLWCITLAIKCTTESMYWCTCTSEASLQSLQAPDVHDGMCNISHQVYCRGHDVLQKPHFNHLGVLHILSCKSGASRGVLYLPARVLHMPSCTSEASLGVLYLPTGVLHMPSSNTRSSTGVYYISHQLHCRGHDALQEPHFSHLFVLHLPSSVLQRPWCVCTSGASLQSLGCAAYPIM